MLGSLSVARSPAAAAALACSIALTGPVAAQDAEPENKRRDVAAVEPGRAAEDATPAATETELCTLIESAANQHGIPVGFFTRLIWKESRFRADALSPKGAQGIAQFMPDTAAERGLLDPFDPAAALPASASLLAELSARFGNLGLAAAAYNAGAQRVSNWLADTATRSLPYETQDFVASITGIPAETWADPEAKAELPAEMQTQPCLTLAANLKVPGNPIGPPLATESGPWGAQVAGNFSRARAVAAYANLQKRYPALIGKRPPMVIGARVPGRGRRAFYRVRVPAQSRKEAEAICADLKSAGAPCIVLKT